MDVVTITKKVGFVKPEVVSISGQVQSTGKYTLSSRVDRVSDIVRRSGGLIDDAYSEGAFIKRSRYNIDSLKSDESKTSIEEAYNRKFKAQQETEKENLVKVAGATTNAGAVDPNSQKKKLKDTLDVLYKELEQDYYQIAIDINQIMKNPGSELDLVLRDKDEVVIPKMDNRVKISGGVLRPTNIVYRDGLSIGECISAAGGISEYAKRGRAYVIYANGKSNRTKHFGFFRINPTIKPGSEVVLPETNEKKDKPLNTIVQLISILAQIGGTLATISILNILDLDKIERAIHSQTGIHNYQYNFLSYPEYLKAELLPEKYRDEARRMVSYHKTWLSDNNLTSTMPALVESILENHDNIEKLEETRKYLGDLDVIRKTNSKELFPYIW